MNDPREPNRRTVLKTIGAGVVGGTMLTGTATAHGEGERVPAWLLTAVYEMADRPPAGEDPTAHESAVPIYHIAPGAAGDGNGNICPQVEDYTEFTEIANTHPKLDNESGAWNSVKFDQTLHDKPGDPGYEYSVLWHIKFVFDANAEPQYVPGDMVNSAEIDLNGDGDTDDTVTVEPFPGFGIEVDEWDVPLINSGIFIEQAADPDVAPGKEVEVVSAPFTFNCPVRPAQGDHLNYCG